VKHVFFSAKREQDRIDAAHKLVIKTESSSDEAESDQESDDQNQPAEEGVLATGTFTREFQHQMEKEEYKEMKKPKISDSDDESEPVMYDMPVCLSRGQLLRLLRQRRSEVEFDNPNDRLVIGTVGYPNVGKSSVINVLLASKKVGVASLPGKTKHF
jgi:large subunit GTPase 1